MRHLKTFLITMILLFSCFSLTVFAEESAVTITDDYQTLYLNGESYTRFNSSLLEYEDGYYTVSKPVTLSDAQQQTISNIELEANEQNTIIYATISFIDGGTLSISFLQDDYIDIYHQITGNQVNEFIIDFEWPEENTVTADRNALFGEATTLSPDRLEWSDWYYVTAESEDKSLTVLKGMLFIIDESYYYTDFAEAGIANGRDFSPYTYGELSAYQITDETLLVNLKEAEELFYEDDMGFLYDDNFTEKLSAVFLIFVFAVIPFIFLVIFLILAIRKKAVYRKLFVTVCILTALELAIFASIASFIMMLR